jgi:uncharacterized protein involved in exopolysaccharide biosynthesis
LNRSFRNSSRLLAVAEPIVPEPDVSPEAAAQGGQIGFSVAQIVAIARAYWKIALLLWLVITAASAVVIKFLPKTYTATAELIVDTNNKDPLAGQEFPVNLLNNYVATQTELIQGPVILLSVIDRLNLTEDKDFAASARAGLAGRRDYAAARLGEALTVEQGRGGQLLYLSVSSRDPNKAALLANTITDVYLEEQRRRINEPAGQRAQRYAEQISELRAKVAVAQEKLAEYRKQKGITNVTADADPDNPDTETQALSSIEGRLLDAQNARRAVEARMSGAPISSDEALASPMVQQLQGQLRAQQSQLVQLSATLGPQHPKVLEIKSQIEATQVALKQETNALGANTATELSRAKALEAQYQQAADEQRAKVLRLREVQGEGGKLALELESAEAVYKRALDGYDQIMFASVGDYTNVSIVNRADPPVGSKPNKPKLFGMAAFIALMFGCGVPILYELLLDRRVRCRDDIERSLGIPVLAQFGRISSRLLPV